MRRLTLITNPDKCNLRCPLCFLNQRGRAFGMGEMPIELAISSIEKACGDHADAGTGGTWLREVIPSTMGEPLLYSKFKELLGFCESRKIPLNMTTNGSFPGEWGTEAGMLRLLCACSDIKVSCMGFGETFAEMMPGLAFDTWKSNLLQLIRCRDRLRSGASVSLQVTLHKKNVDNLKELLFWARKIGVDRVKLNVAVFLSVASPLLLESYALSEGTVASLHDEIVTLRPVFAPMRLEGSLFFDKSNPRRSLSCLFEDELWVLPDGSEEHCPNSERRFGNPSSEMALCENCPMC